MVRYFVTAALAVLLSVTLVRADAPKCGPGSLCPASAPCCSQYGQCGVGAYCLGGCDPLFSHQLDSCVVAPVCKSADYTLKSLDDVMSIDKYLGDSSSINWVSQGQPVVYNNALLLTMAQDTVGTLLASTHYVWYGKISAKMTTSQGQGVVTAFIMMSDVKDEIDFEFIGVDIEHAQSNYYSQGVTNYHNEENLTVSNTVENVHEYTIDWQPDTLTWSIDGNVMRTLKRSDTWNATANRFDYPQTPSRIMLSLWPAGLSTNDIGTVNWAGGLINWNSPYMQNGYYYAMVQEVSLQCYDPPSGANITGKNSYVYNNEAGTNNTVAIVDETEILASFYATGENPSYNPNAVVSGSKSSAASAPTQSVETVPGMSGGGNRGGDPVSSASASAGEATGTASVAAGESAATGSAAAQATASGGFSQGGGNAAGSGASALKTEGRVLGGSVLAICVAVLGLLVI
ncbi:glycoside hydrolase family 16 protein [Lepidopterella palustris CBS 459.81]|uniref:Crh-like protein n=1 Tax=Lepidopterella palustris CBS 459.81 TaxID=1314670 RepID=A0A8E2J9E0_9PEZI|nr:glycoside hydrolase family 16 protein [Lepidopterella palustris CBS 459.81]